MAFNIIKAKNNPTTANIIPILEASFAIYPFITLSTYSEFINFSILPQALNMKIIAINKLKLVNPYKIKSLLLIFFSLIFTFSLLFICTFLLSFIFSLLFKLLS